MIQIKENILNASREKCQGPHIIIAHNISTTTLKLRRVWEEYLQTLKDQICQDWLLHLAKHSINIDGVTKIFPDNTKFKQYISTSQVLLEILEGKLPCNEANKNQNQIKQKIKYTRNIYVPNITTNSIIETHKHTHTPQNIHTPHPLKNRQYQNNRN